MQFSYIAISNKAEHTKETIEAESLEEAQAKLSSRGIWYKNLRQKESIRFSFKFFRTKKITYKKLSSLSQGLSLYLKAGIPLLSALGLIKNQQDDKATISFLQSISKELEEGNSLYRALEKQEVFTLPPFYMYSVQVAQESGTLQAVLDELAIYLENLDSIQKKLTQAMIYPMFIIFLAVLMVGFMLTVVVPKITQVFDGLGQELPKITKAVIYMGDFLQSYWLVIGLFLLFITLLFQFCYKKFISFHIYIDKLILKIPLYKKIALSWELARFSYISHILLRSGVTFIHAVKLATNTMNNLFLQKLFEQATSSVIEGSQLSKSLKNVGFDFDNSFIQALAIGEETSELEGILQNISKLYIKENNDRIAVFMALFEPILILLVGITIGIIVTAMLLPIFSINLAGR